MFHSNVSNIQHGVRIEAVFASFKQGEHTDRIQQFPAYIQSSRQNNIILQTELILQEEGKRDSSASSQSLNTVFSTAFPVFSHAMQQVSSHPCKGNYPTHRINSSTRNLQEILQLQGSSHAGRYKASSSNCSLCIQVFYPAETLLVTL